MSRLAYRLRFPSDVTAEQVTAMSRSLSVRRRHGLFGASDPVLFELISRAGKLEWNLEVSEREAATVLANVRASVPSLRLEPITAARPGLSHGWELRLSDLQRPLRTDVTPQVVTSLLNAILGLHRGEAMTIQWLVGPWLIRPVVPSVKKEHEQPRSWLDARPRRDSEQLAALARKQKEPVFGVVGRIMVSADTKSRRRQLLQRALGALQLVRAPGVGFRRRLRRAKSVPLRGARRQHPLIAWPNVLSASELAAVLAWPVGGPVLPGVRYGGQRQLPAPERALVRHTNGQRITGRATFPGREVYLHQVAPDALRHTWVIGPTGVGKSTLLANLVLADITAGRSAVVVDPKGDLVTDIIDRLPPERLSDIVLLDGADQERPIGLNPLAGTDPDLAVDTVLHILHELFAAHWGPRTSDVLHAGLLTLARRGGYTLCELPALLTNPQLRRAIVGSARLDTIGLGPFWSWYEGLSEAERAVVIGPAMNKLRTFTLRPALRLMLGQVGGFDLQRIFTERKVLLVSLSKGTIGTETAQLLGSLLLGQLWPVIQRRSTIAPERRHPVVLYLDEFHEYLRLPGDLGDFLVQARGLGVGIVAAHQHLGQLPPAMRSAVLHNLQTRICFQLGHEDAALVAKVLGGGLSATDLQGLAAFETYQALSVGGSTAPPTSAVTLPLASPFGTAEAVRTHSRETYGTARTDVEAALAARRLAVPDQAPIGTRRRPSREARS